MLSLPPAVRVFVALEPTDMRKSFHGLEGETRRVIEQDPVMCENSIGAFQAASRS